MQVPTVKIPAGNARGWKIINADDPRAKEATNAEGQGLRTEGRAQEVTRTDIARMKRGDVLDLLEAHGITEADIEGVMLPELRALAARTVFADL